MTQKINFSIGMNTLGETNNLMNSLMSRDFAELGAGNSILWNYHN